MRYLVICSMRDEGPFIVEWVAWYRMLGFTDIMVLTNDCTDHSPELLDALQDAGWIRHIDVPVPPGEQPLRLKLRAAKNDPLAAAADYILVCDVDEFLVIHAGAGRIGDLVEGISPGFIGMSLNWRVFGSSGQAQWQDGLVHRQFRRAAPVDKPSGRWFKALFRRPEIFKRLGAHGPSGIDLSKLDGAWNEGDRRWVDSAGRILRIWSPDGPYLKLVPQRRVTYEKAQLNHYMIRALENFEMKRGTASAAALFDRYTDEYLRLYDRNEVEDTAASAYAAEFDAIHAAAMDLPGVKRLHHLCCADLVLRAGEKLGFNGRADPRYAHHMDCATPGQMKRAPPFPAGPRFSGVR